MNRRVLFACLVLAPLAMYAAQARQTTDRPQPTPRHQATPAPQDAGERVFAANCSRCHQPPMSLSPRITGTVIMHMRTRARLSREDEKLLLKFLAP
jgi:cytochrome c5